MGLRGVLDKSFPARSCGDVTQVGSSIVEDRQVELVEACGVGKYVDLDDLSVRDRET